MMSIYLNGPSLMARASTLRTSRTYTLSRHVPARYNNVNQDTWGLMAISIQRRYMSQQQKRSWRRDSRSTRESMSRDSNAPSKPGGWSWLQYYRKQRGIKRHCMATLNLISNHLNVSNPNKVDSFDNVTFSSLRKFGDIISVTTKTCHVEKTIQGLNDEIPQVVKDRVIVHAKNHIGCDYISNTQTYESGSNEGIGYRVMLSTRIIDEDTVSLKLAVSGLTYIIGSGVENVQIEEDVVKYVPITKQYLFGLYTRTTQQKIVTTETRNETRVTPKEMSFKIFCDMVTCHFDDHLRALTPVIESSKAD